MILGKMFSPFKAAGPFFLRLGLGAVFMYHGGHKVGILGEKGFSDAIQGAANAAKMVGFEPANIWGYALAFTEVIGGLLLVLGLFTRYAALALGFIMFIAAWKVHGANGFSNQNGGFEYQMVLIACCLALLVQGAGLISLDKRLGYVKED